MTLPLIRVVFPRVSFHEVRGNDNEVTQMRNVIYLAEHPGIEAEMDFLHTWMNPQIKAGVARTNASTKSTDTHFQMQQCGRVPTSTLSQHRCQGLTNWATPFHQMGRRLSELVISILPGDGHALMMLLEHDIFEDEDEDFCYGRVCTCTFLGGFFSNSYPFQILRHAFVLLWYVSRLKSQPLNLEKER